MPAKVTALNKMLCGKLAAETHEGGHHTQYVIWHEGQKVATTSLSRSYTELDDSMLAKLAQQLHIKKPQLQLLIDCPWTRDKYLAHVLDRQD